MSRTGWPSSSKERGFTLFELAIVLLLIGVFGSLVFSRVGDFFTDGDLRTASRMVIQEIHRARSLAAQSRSPRYLALDMERNSLYVSDSPSALSADLQSSRHPWETGKDLPVGVFLEDVAVLSGQKIQEGVAWLRFRPDGSGERALIHLRNSRERVYTLELAPLTGQVRLHDTYVEQRQG